MHGWAQPDWLRFCWRLPAVCARRPRLKMTSVPSAVRLLQLGFRQVRRPDEDARNAYLCFCTLSNPFSNSVTSGASPETRPSRPMTRQR
jgi:hypothetical protein